MRHGINALRACARVHLSYSQKLTCEDMFNVLPDEKMESMGKGNEDGRVPVLARSVRLPRSYCSD